MVKKTKILLFFALFFILAIAWGAADIVVVHGLTYQKEAGVGETYTDSIELRNTEAKPQEVKIYQTDYHFNANGEVFYDEAGKLGRSNAAWMKFSPDYAVIAANGTITIDYEIKVPENPDLKGTYWSMLMVEGISEQSPESSRSKLDKNSSISIRQVFRYGLQIVTNIGNTGKKEIKFVRTKLNQEGKRSLEVDVENTGEQWLRGELWVEFYDNEGNFINKFGGGSFRMYPETSVRYRVDISSLTLKRKYKALVILDCGANDVFGVNLRLEP